MIARTHHLLECDEEDATARGDSDTGFCTVLAYITALNPNQLGHPSFQDRYGVHAHYVAGAMANGIASEAVVIEMAKAG